VRAAGPGESIRTLDGNDRKLDSDILVIADKQRPLAVAGVMGGEETEINGQTGSILLESACFAPADIRFTSAKLGVTTESSYRFERGVDMDNVERAGRRAAKLMVEYADALPAAGVVDNYPGKSAPRRAGCRYSRVNKVLGAEVPAEEIASIFESLGMPVDDESEDRCEVTVPSFRKDIVIEADLIEEVARIHGLDSIPAGDPNARIVPGADDTEWMKTGQCRSVMAGLGFDEIANYSTASGLLLDKASPENPDNRLYLPNPVSSDHDVLRDSLAPQMLDTLGRNHARQVEDAALFEIGRVFGTSDGKDFEEDRISIGLMGTPGGRRYGMDARPDGEQTFLAAKGAIEELCCTLHAGPLSLRTEHRRCLDESASLSLFLDGRKAGFIGLAAPELLREWRIEKPVAIAELELEPLKKNAFSKPSPLPVPQYPAVSRDMALVVDDSVLNGDIERIIWENAPAELTSVRLFDIFTDEGRIGSGRKSVAYTLSYRSSERTLTDEDANRYHEDVKAALKRELKAEVREG
jgi:phenylalanyl-tRNA synthetase beta chain